MTCQRVRVRGMLAIVHRHPRPPNVAGTQEFFDGRCLSSRGRGQSPLELLVMSSGVLLSSPIQGFRPFDPKYVFLQPHFASSCPLYNSVRVSEID
jgi:hypothetical protein